MIGTFDKTQFQIHRERMRDWALLWRRWVYRAPEAARFFIDMAVARRALSVQSERVAEGLKGGSAAVLELSHAKSDDAHCLACGFQMIGGANVGLCPKCGSDRWYKTRLTPNRHGSPTFSPDASSSPAGSADPARSEGDQQRPPTDIEMAQLLQLFEMHSGFIPGRELTAEGFEIRDLIARRLIAAPRSHLDGGCYTVGTELVAAVRRVRSHVLSMI